MDDEEAPPRWSDPVEPEYKIAGWTCLAILLAPLIAIIWFVVVTTLQHG